MRGRDMLRDRIDFLEICCLPARLYTKVHAYENLRFTCSDNGFYSTRFSECATCRTAGTYDDETPDHC